MSIKRLILMTTLVAALLPAGAAFCQPNDYRMDPPFTDFSSFSDYTPFVEPGYFDHDLKFFAPTEIDEFSGPPKPKTGYFGEYNRLYAAMGRGRADLQTTFGGNFSWGNRMVIGYMTDNDTGWSVEYQKQSGVSYTQNNPVVALQRQVTTPTLALVAVNDFNFPQISVASEFHTVEIDKVFRMEPWQDGGYWEAFVGAKYSYSRDSMLTRRTEVGLLLSDSLLEVKNDMLFASLGARFSKRKGSWKMSGEVRAFAGPSFQSTFIRNNLAPIVPNPTVSPGGLNAANALPLANRPVFTQGSSESFVVGGDILMQSEFALTRDISITGGWILEHYGTGVLRIVADGSDSLTRAGVFGGIVVNR